MMETVMTGVGPTLDIMAIVLLAAVLWRLGRDPGAPWSEREARLQTIFDDLRTLVAQSEGLARDLDGKLAGREERLQALLAEAQAVTSGQGAAEEAIPGRPPRLDLHAEASRASAGSVVTGVGASALEPAEMASRIEALADAGTAVGEIARRLGVAIAEVRLVIGLKAVRMARRRATALETATHA